MATLDGRWKKTTLDGFGRTIQVDSGHGTVSDANTVSRRGDAVRAVRLLAAAEAVASIAAV